MTADFLRQEFLKEAKVIDAQKGYISVSSFNLRMKPSVLQVAASLIADNFKDDKVTVVHGIPHSGVYFATAVALQLSAESQNIRLHTSRKDQHIPATWKDVFRKEIRSFTTSLGGADVYSGLNFSFVKKGDRVLLIDDVCATGSTACTVIEGLQERGIEVMGFGVLFDKMFQEGLERVEGLGVKTFSCIRVKKIGKRDKIVLED